MPHRDCVEFDGIRIKCPSPECPLRAEDGPRPPVAAVAAVAVAMVPAACPPRLTSRQADVARLVIAGLSNKQIAARLGLVEKTVSLHRSHLLRRPDVGGIAGLVLFALAQGWIGPDGRPLATAGTGE